MKSRNEVSPTGFSIRGWIPAFVILAVFVLSPIGRAANAAEMIPTPDVDISGQWSFVQYWSVDGNLKSVLGSLTLEKVNSIEYLFKFQWIRDGNPGSSQWKAVRDQDGLVVATGVEMPKAGIILGRGQAENCMSGVLFHPATKVSGVSGMQICRSDANFDQAAIAGWKTSNGAATVMQTRFFSPETVGFEQIRKDWIAQAKAGLDQDGVAFELDGIFLRSINTPQLASIDQSEFERLLSGLPTIDFTTYESAVDAIANLLPGLKVVPAERRALDSMGNPWVGVRKVLFVFRIDLGAGKSSYVELDIDFSCFNEGDPLKLTMATLRVLHQYRKGGSRPGLAELFPAAAFGYDEHGQDLFLAGEMDRTLRAGSVRYSSKPFRECSKREGGGNLECQVVPAAEHLLVMGEHSCVEWTKFADGTTDDGASIHLMNGYCWHYRIEQFSFSLGVAVVGCLRTGAAECLNELMISKRVVEYLDTVGLEAGQDRDGLMATSSRGIKEAADEMQSVAGQGKKAGFDWSSAEVDFVKPGSLVKEWGGVEGFRVLLSDKSGRRAAIRVDGVVMGPKGFVIVKGLDWLAESEVSELIEISGVGVQ